MARHQLAQSLSVDQSLSVLPQQAGRRRLARPPRARLGGQVAPSGRGRPAPRRRPRSCGARARPRPPAAPADGRPAMRSAASRAAPRRSTRSRTAAVSVGGGVHGSNCGRRRPGAPRGPGVHSPPWPPPAPPSPAADPGGRAAGRRPGGGPAAARAGGAGRARPARGRADRALRPRRRGPPAADQAPRTTCRPTPGRSPCPGARSTPRTHSARDAALRETEEEVGLPRDRRCA